MNKNDRKLYIVECAKQLFVENGFHNTSITDIVDKARIARSTFYAHFTSKIEIFSILVESFSGILLEAILGINISKATNRANLSGEIKLMSIELVRALDGNRDLTILLITASQGHDTNFDKIISDFYGGILLAIRQLLVEGIEAGNIRNLNPDIVSFTILGNIKQILIQWLVYGEIDDIYGVLDDVGTFNLHGIAQGNA